MGLTFHYSGRLNKDASLRDLVEEVRDISLIYKWNYSIFEEKFPLVTSNDAYNDKIYGICFTPPACETVWLCFLSNGKMSNPVNLQFYGNSNDKEEQEYLYMLSVKTQFAGIEVHKLIIHLFRYLNEKYFSHFKLYDEGEYWETGDEELLRKNFERYNFLLNSFTTALETFPVKKDEPFESYFERLMKYVRDKYKG